MRRGSLVGGGLVLFLVAAVFVWPPASGLAREARVSQELTISPIKAVFSEADRSTTYSVPQLDDFTSGANCCKYQWTLTLQAVDPNQGVDYGCNNHGILGGTGSTFTWHHGNIGDATHDDGCNHTKQGLYGHQGLISVIVSDDQGGICSATYKGTYSSDANSVTNGIASEPVCTDCDAQKAEVAALQAQVDGYTYMQHTAGQASIYALQAMQDAEARMDDLSGPGPSIFYIRSLHKKEIKQAAQDFQEAQILNAEMDDLFDRVSTRLSNAKGNLRSAQRDLTACLNRKSTFRLTAARPRPSSTTAAPCGAQQIALAQAQAALSVYEWAAGAFARTGLAQDRGRLLEAERLLEAVRSKLPKTPKDTTLARALDRAVASLGLAAARVGQLNAAVGRLKAKVRPAQQQVATATSDLTACRSTRRSA